MEVRATRLVPGRVPLYGQELPECRVTMSRKDWSLCYEDLNRAAVNSGMPRAQSDAGRGGWEGAGRNRGCMEHSSKNFTSPPRWSMTQKIKHENRKKWF